MVFCEKCNQEIVGKYVFNNDKPELKNKKFCSKFCMEQYYNQHKSSGSGKDPKGSDFNWKDYKGWIIGGVIFFVLIIILSVILNKREK